MILHLALVALFWFDLSTSAQATANTARSYHLPLVRREVRRSYSEKRDDRTASIGTGDFMDVTYNVLVKIGGVETALVLDTGSADLWVVSNQCASCTSTVPLYQQSSFQPTGQQIQLLYGDSHTGTHASGPIGTDDVSLAGLMAHQQYLAAITDTNTTVLETGSAGILGLGFPVISLLWRQLLQAQLSNNPPTKRDRPAFPSFDFILGPSNPHSKRQIPPLFSSAEVIDSFATYGPLFSRLVGENGLASPMFTTTLQRDTLTIGGNVGLLSIGGLPAGIQSGSLTWVPLRAYSVQEGGLPPDPRAPNEVFPLVWEIAVDDVFFDGIKLPRSSLSPSTITLSALVDTGNSLIRGPQDVIAEIYDHLGGENFECAKPHTLTFQIGGQMFPVDSRDFVRQSYADTVEWCSANLAITDPPGEGFLYSWSLGDPFIKSALVAFHYGNLTRPSEDPPRIGLLSTVSGNSGDLLKDAVDAADVNSGNFPATSDAAPSGTYVATATGVGGVPQASSFPLNVTVSPESSSSGSMSRSSISTTILALCALLTVGLSSAWIVVF
ncbi:aspartic peptidase domain-containing protein [Cytidiella melzeri]|nr:aspartic peptidase domain-containing protein [Cytidiella melzeri]